MADKDKERDVRIEPAGRIRLLPVSLVDLIAAGEVVERPLSVVKELMENSLDAGGRNIWVEITGTPDSHLLVSDDGGGMTQDEAVLAFERHSTSKITSAGDLDRIATFGFRGEALPSIASVSRVTLTTIREGAKAGCEIELEGGKILNVREAGRGRGTTITVRDLFFNTPARRKFLKSPRGETKAISKLVTAFALVNPASSFTLVSNGKKNLSLQPSGNLRGRVLSVFGERTVDSMVEIPAVGGQVELSGMLGKPELSRNSAEHVFIFVNNRWVQSPVIMRALREGYRDLVPHDRYPMAVLCIKVSPEQVDVNVHPSKREIRFRDDKVIFETVREGVRNALYSEGGIQAADHRAVMGIQAGGKDAAVDIWSDAGAPNAGAHPTGTAGESGAGAYGQMLNAKDGLSFVKELLRDERESPEEDETAGRGLVSLWQFHGTYIMGEIKGGIVLIDQHAAHERILYEQAMASFRGQDRPSQQLLFPMVLDFAKDEFETLLDMSQWLKKLGFEVSVFGERTVLVKGIPSTLRRWDEGQVLRDMVDLFSEGSEDEFPPEEKAARAFACSGAIKAGEPLNQTEMNWLINSLFMTKVPDGDPHGRPTFIRLSLAELEKRFGRR